MPLRSLAFLAYFLGSTSASILVPMAGVICYIVLYHVYPETTWWGPHLKFLGIRYSFICGLCLMIGTILNLNRLPLGRRLLHPVEGMFLVMLLAIVVSATTSGQWSFRTEQFLDKMSKVFLFVLLMSHVVVTRSRIWQLTLLFTVMGLYLGHEARIAPPGSFRTSRLDGIGGPDFRESSGLAIHLFALMPFVVVVFRQRSVGLKLLAFLAAGYSLNAVLLCRTRSAFLAGLIAALFAIWYVPHRHRRWVILVLILAAVGGILLSDNWFWERMVTIFSSQDERDQSAAMRFSLWHGAWEMFRHNPWGVGIGQFEQEIGRYTQDPQLEWRNAHNSFLLCLTETGIFGFAAFMLTIFLSWRTLSITNRQVRKRLRDPSLFEMVIFANRLALIVYLAAGFFVSRLYTEAMWWFLAFPVCLDRAVENEIRAQDAAEESTAEQPALAFDREALAGWGRECSA